MTSRRTERLRSFWDSNAGRYDTATAWLERRFLGDSRGWIGSRASGRTLELAIGTGANLPHYGAGVVLTGTDWSDAMLRLATARAAGLGRELTTVCTESAALPFDDGSFDTVVCTYGLCSARDVGLVLRESYRVLVPGGSLLLADHVAPTNPFLRVGAHLLEAVTIPAQGEHLTRRPLNLVPTAGFHVVASERLHRGVIERVHAKRPL